MRINLASTRLAFLLIAALVLLIILSAIIPQDDISSGQIVDWQEKLGDIYYLIDTLGLNRIYYTPTFFIVLGLLAINLTVGNVRRFRGVYRIEKTFLKARHLGSILFHLSLLAIMSGAILHFLFKYEGVFSLTEGQTVRDVSSAYHREYQGPLHVASYDQFSMKLEAIGHTVGEVDSLGSKASVILTPVEPSGQPITADISTNHPLKWGDYEFHFGSVTGYSPELVLLDSAGETLFRSFMRVSRHNRPEHNMNFDYLEIESVDLKIEIEVIGEPDRPDLAQYQVMVLRDDSELYSGLMKSTDSVAFSGLSLSIPRLRRWCYIGAIRNSYLNLIFTGFWLSLAGLCLSLVGRIGAPRS